MAIGLGAAILAQAAGAAAAYYGATSSSPQNNVGQYNPEYTTQPAHHNEYVYSEPQYNEDSPYGYQYSPSPQQRPAFPQQPVAMLESSGHTAHTANHNEVLYDSQSMPDFGEHSHGDSQAIAHVDTESSAPDSCTKRRKCNKDRPPSPCHPYGYMYYHYWPRHTPGQYHYFERFPRHYSKNVFGCRRH